MKKENKIVHETANESLDEQTSAQQDSDQAILDQINKRNSENLALKKLLENLNSSLPKSESK